MGWAFWRPSPPPAERAAQTAILADSEDPVAPLRARLRLSAHAALRRFAGRVRTGAAAQPELFDGAGYYGLTLSYCGRWEEGRLAARRALRLSPRDPFSAVYYGITAYSQFIGRNYEEAMRLARAAIRQRGDFVGAHRVLTARAAGEDDIANAALQELRRAPPNISLAWTPTRSRPGRTPTANTIWKRFAAPA